MKNNYSLLAHNTFGIEASARYYAEYTSVEQLQQELTAYYQQEGIKPQATEKLPVLHIGGGSNLLFLHDYEGLVLHSAIQGIEVVEETPESVLVRVGAGMVWDDLVAETLKRGWYGLENLSLIPGEVGASAVQNIGAYGAEAKDFIQRVWLFDLYSLIPCCKTVEEMQYAYRYSLLKNEQCRGRYAVTHVDFLLNKTFTPQLSYGGLRRALEQEGIAVESLDAQMLRDVIIRTREGKLPDPKVLGNAGSFFMNPIVEREVYDKLQAAYPEMPHYEVDAEHVKIPAGWLIEKAGWKGRSLGRAGVYERQALVLVNLGGARGADIVTLCEQIRKDVRSQFGIDIHPEVNFIG